MDQNSTAAQGREFPLSSRKVQGIVAAVVVSGTSIWAAAGFTREPPTPPPEPKGMQVGKGNVTLAANAPQWKVLRLGAVAAAAMHWSDPVPARVKIDESRASKVGAPLGGRVTQVFEVWVVAELFEGDALGIEEGTLAKITSPSLPDLTLEAKVTMVSSVVDPTRHTIPVRVRLNNDKHLLKPNIFAQMRFAVEPRENSGEVAASALVTDGSKQYVYVQTEHGRFTRREVVAGSMREGKVPILSGLKPDEVVVEDGAILLDNQVALSR